MMSHQWRIIGSLTGSRATLNGELRPTSRRSASRSTPPAGAPAGASAIASGPDSGCAVVVMRGPLLGAFGPPNLRTTVPATQSAGCRRASGRGRNRAHLLHQSEGVDHVPVLDELA